MNSCRACMHDRQRHNYYYSYNRMRGRFASRGWDGDYDVAMRGRPRRILLRAGVFLLLSGGAIVNVAVAWGCATALGRRNDWRLR